MGVPFMPWQRHDVADVALEVNPDGTWAYGVVIVHVQRQAGKTTLFGPVANHRCATRPDGKVWLTAQTGYDARDVWLDVAKRVERSPFARAVKIRRANGTESMTWPNGATFRPFPPVEDAMHGKANELVAVDEGWAFSDEVGTSLEAAILPTFTTTGGQLWILSAGGTSRSAWLLRHVIAGRASVLAGVTSGIAYFEYGVDTALDASGTSPASRVAAGLEAWKADPADERARDDALEVVLAAHPAAGETLRRDALITAAGAMKVGEFMRAYANVWTPGGERVIPETLWDAAGRDTSSASAWPRPAVRPALGFAASVDHRDAAIVAAWRDGPGRPMRVDPIAVEPGIAWLAPRVVELARELRPVALGHDRAGPVVDLADEVTRDPALPAGLELASTSTADYAAACSAFLRAVMTGQLEHPRNADLDAAAAAAARRIIGDGAWAWSRRASSASIAVLEAATQAAWAFDHRPPPPATPVIVARPTPGASPAVVRRRRRS